MNPVMPPKIALLAYKRNFEGRRRKSILWVTNLLLSRYPWNFFFVNEHETVKSLSHSLSSSSYLFLSLPLSDLWSLLFITTKIRDNRIREWKHNLKKYHNLFWDTEKKKKGNPTKLYLITRETKRGKGYLINKLNDKLKGKREKENETEDVLININIEETRNNNQMWGKMYEIYFSSWPKFYKQCLKEEKKRKKQKRTKKNDPIYKLWKIENL